MRLKQFSQELRKQKVDAAFFLSTESNTDKSVLYFSGCDAESSMIVKNGKAVLFVKSLELENARKHTMIKPITWKGDFFRFLKKKLKKIRTMGINKDSLSLNAYKKLRKAFPKTKFRDVSKIVKRLREIKTKEEIIIMKKAASIGDKIFSKLMKEIKNFKTEKQVMNFIIEETRKNGCEPSFPPIVASGNSATPHNEATGKLKKGFCFIDLGVKYKGYCSDMTRTVFIGKPEKKDKDVYEMLLGIQEDAIKKTKRGVSAQKILKEVNNNLGRYKKYFTHGLGHQIGLDVHEGRGIRKKEKDFRLEEGMIITIEPGVYKRGEFGIRIEDMVLVGKNAEIMTKTTKKMIVVR